MIMTIEEILASGEKMVEIAVTTQKEYDQVIYILNKGKVDKFMLVGLKKGNESNCVAIFPKDSTYTDGLQDQSTKIKIHAADFILANTAPSTAPKKKVIKIEITIKEGALFRMLYVLNITFQVKAINNKFVSIGLLDDTNTERITTKEFISSILDGRYILHERKITNK